MRISLATSLHLDHGAMSLDANPGSPLPMQVFVPLGLLALKAVCDQQDVGAEVAVLELNTLINDGEIPNDDGFFDHIAELTLKPGDDMVGLMTDGDSLHHTVAIARRIKARSPHTLVCVGGPTTSPMGRRFLERFVEFDFLVRGEGDLTFAELALTLVGGREPTEVRGLTWRRKGDIFDNPDRDLVLDLDQLPIPDFSAYPKTGEAALYLDVGRGCPFKCHFCATALFWNRRYRMKSIDRILAEMKLLRDEFRRTHVNYSHDIFTCDRRWAHEFCDRLKQAGLGMTWTCSTRTDIIDPELLAHMAEAGCIEIYYGIETGSKAMQGTISKDLDLNWSRHIVAATAAVGIRPVTGFIVGYPNETRESLEETLRCFFDFLEVGDFRAHLFTLCPFHESPMFAQYKNMINRRAEYHDLPLTPAATAHSVPLIAEHPDIFASAYRYDTPHLAVDLVAASEELSPRLVLLKRIWPRLLCHYLSPLDWYEAWTRWIAAENAARCGNSPLAHQGTVLDLLNFLKRELHQLAADDSELADLVRYEEVKFRAQIHLPAAAHSDRPTGDLNPLSLVVRSQSLLVASFETDLSVLLNGRATNNHPVAANGNDQSGGFWVVFAKTVGDTLGTMQIGHTAKRLLDLATDPTPVGDLIQNALLRSAPPDDAYEHCLGLIRRLVERNLLWEITSP